MWKIIILTIIVGGSAFAKPAPTDIKKSVKEGIYLLTSGDERCTSGRVTWIDKNGMISLQVGSGLIIPDINSDKKYEEQITTDCHYSMKSWLDRGTIIHESVESCTGDAPFFRRVEVLNTNDNLEYLVFNKHAANEKFEKIETCELHFSKD